MKKITKILLSATIAGIMMIQSAAFAQEFSDMPDDWTTASIERAVENGLIGGYDDGTVKPNNNILRSEMAAIIVRAFGATKEADISMYPDVLAEKWYYKEFAKAVQMGAFSGTDDGKLNPEANITYEECFTVISRIFCLMSGDPTLQSNLDAVDDSVLNAYEDASMIASWAKKYTALVVGQGYWNGYEGKLKPQGQYITRAEFAVLMDNLIKVYINEPGEYTEFADGNILVRTAGVTIKDYTGDDIILVGDGVLGDTNITNINSTSEIVLRGGNTIITGKMKDLSLCVDGVTATWPDFRIGLATLYLNTGTNLSIETLDLTPTE